ncbi:MULTISPECIES: fumarylacetoacetate hydrolase family protein [unclassified Neisseria]|uniref:fumarylacetoacetate hydrolase family protein n=1 Tax=unclassified Neisseria TaxID=2623750 RepID=UPI0026652CC2|nr:MULTISPECIES: fumarylacetoacetate hydrolase family protein [unclassified Neisseria]MDO1508830.1 fumarylacetoacetate hydrolase family protein [Neisseria sp. MVDL19-042950]MDO1515089.1 fumarylacetoacetate hydrolase family protein [Neisseria sp. MVDL18-041461]MDO1562449.1 fumarylacetoacetate hydrolase family protein [Neisseria sp. MVDL20-010259]
MVNVILEKQTVDINNIYCIGRNYVDHIAELKNETPTEPVVFMKPNNSILHSGGTIRLPAYSRSVHYESELVLLIGKDSDGLNSDDLTEIIAGYGVGLDLTARDVQGRLKEKGLPWTKAKGFRGAACVSEFIGADKLVNPQNCKFTFKVNGEMRQCGETSHMIYPLPAILKELAETYGLCRGDVVFTGTPAGVGELHAGDRLELDLAGTVQAFFEVV